MPFVEKSNIIQIVYLFKYQYQSRLCLFSFAEQLKSERLKQILETTQVNFSDQSLHFLKPFFKPSAFSHFWKRKFFAENQIFKIKNLNIN